MKKTFKRMAALATAFILTATLSISALADAKPTTLPSASVVIGDVLLMEYEPASIFNLIADAVKKDLDSDVYYAVTSGPPNNRGLYNLSTLFSTTGGGANHIP